MSTSRFWNLSVVPPSWTASHQVRRRRRGRAGDKDRAFAGSRQWVGAIELSYVLEQMVGVQCKVLTVGRGAELPARARDIAHHFDTQGGCGGLLPAAASAAPLGVTVPL